MMDFVNGGKGIVGIHSAVDNFYEWPEGAALMGALFDFWDPQILQFYLDGIQYALGDLPADATPSAKLKPAPEPVLAPKK